MTVNELIEQLKQYPGDMRVVVHGYEGGYNDAGVSAEPLVFNHRANDPWYYGIHESAKFVDGVCGVDSVVIGSRK